MHEPKDSIAELTALVESLAGQWLACGAPESGGGNPEIMGRPLAAWLAELWPGTAALSGMTVGEEQAALILSAASQHRRAVEAEAAKMASGLQKAASRLQQIRQSHEKSLEVFGRVLARAESEVAQRQAELDNIRSQARQWRRTAASLDQWMKSLEPAGRNSFRDGSGKLAGLQQVRQADARRQRAEQMRKVLEEKAHLQGLELQEAQKHRAEAAANMDKARAAERDAARSEELAQARLSNVSSRLEITRSALTDARQKQKQADDLLLTCRKVSQLAGGLLAGAAGQLDQPAAGRLKQVRADLDRAGDLDLRRQRLERLLLILNGRLARLGRRGGEVLKTLRKVNRQIESLELQLPSLVAALSGPQAGDADRRGECAAELSVLLAMLKDLRPKAGQTQAEVDKLRQGLEDGLDRARHLLEAWREAVKDGREAVNQAASGISGLRQDCDALDTYAAQLVGLCRPTVAAMGGMRHLDLAPALGRVVEKAANAKVRAADDRLAADQAEAALGLLPFVALNKPPMTIKAHNVSLRKMSGRNVHLDRLAGLRQASTRWRRLAEGGLNQAINMPLEKVALDLSGSLRLMALDRQSLTARLDQKNAEAGELRRDLGRANERMGRAQRNVGRLHTLARAQRDKLRRTNENLLDALVYQDQAADMGRRMDRAQRNVGRLLSLARAQRDKLLRTEDQLQDALVYQDRAADLGRRLEDALGQIDDLSARLLNSRHMASALRGKMLERHKLLGRVRGEKAQTELELFRLQDREVELASLRSALERSKARHEVAHERAEKAVAERDAALERLASLEQTDAAATGPSLQMAGLQAELDAARQEAAGWAILAGDMSVALAVGQQRGDELEQQVLDLANQANTLRNNLTQLSMLVTLSASLPQGGLEPDQARRLFERLHQARRRLGKAGKSALGQLVLVGGLATGLVLFSVSNPSKATLRGPEGLTPASVELVHGGPDGLADNKAEEAAAKPEPTVKAQAPATTASGPRPLPLYAPQAEMTIGERSRLRKASRRAGLTPRALLLSARAAFPDRDTVEEAELEPVVNASKIISGRHPLIFQEMASHGLPRSAVELAKLAPSPERGRSLFMDRLYREYRDLGLSPDRAIKALTANANSLGTLKKKWQPPQWFKGKVKPLPELEAMGLHQFVDQMSPYIATRCQQFMKQRKMPISGDLKLYARNLAFDIYCAAHMYQVPVTFMLAIGHQETYYANILGDNDLSASPFQIYHPTKLLIIDDMAADGLAPPPKSIDLQENLTMATMMAAYHLRSLLQQSYTPASGSSPSTIDTDKVMKSYNGSGKYAAMVASRQKQIAKFLDDIL